MSSAEDNRYYLAIAELVSKKSTCAITHCGVVIVDKKGNIISTGYSHEPDNESICIHEKICPYYEKYGEFPVFGMSEECRCVHGEIFAILSAERERLKGATIYIYGFDRTKGKPKSIVPNPMISKIIQVAGIRRICTVRGEDPPLFNYYDELDDDIRAKNFEEE